MTMAIEPTGPSTTNINTSSGSSQTTNVQADTIDKNKNKSINKGPGDAVTLTATAEKLKTLEEKLAAVPEVDSERVAKIREALNSGQYKVDSESTAEKFLEFEKSLS